MASIEFPHLFLPDAPEPIDYRNPSGGGTHFETPPRPSRTGHADRIRKALEKAWEQAAQESEERKGVALPAREGTYLEIESAPGFDLRLGSLEDRGADIRLLNVRDETKPNGEVVTKATIYVPHGKHVRLIDKIQRYRDEETSGGAPKNKALVESIENIRKAVLQSFWYDPVEFIPAPNATEWCEVWLVTSEVTQDAICTEFRALAQALGIDAQDGEIRFIERTVLLIKASADDLNALLASYEHIAEFRRAKETAAFWSELPNALQAEWVGDLAGRLSVADDVTTSICVIDTGANNGHPLLSPVLQDQHCGSVDASWGTADTHGHGTTMCGTVTFADRLGYHLQMDTQLELPFLLESVKLIPKPGKQTDERLYGERTQQAISRGELFNPGFNRVYCLAVTSEDGRDRGRPSSWSSAIDNAIAGVGGNEPKLCVISAGNIEDPSEWKSYPHANLTNSVHDPAQSWNGLSVGAITFMDSIDDPELADVYTPVAQAGQLSPYSTSSRTWDRRWPNKPDIVLEGGNVGIDESGFPSQFDAMSLLSLGHKPQEALLSANYATSSAAGLASEMCARLWAAYPEAWPETIRGLMVHSAEWTDALKSQLHHPDATATDNMANLLRVVGYGVPDFQRALQSARSSLTLIAQQSIQPFEVIKEHDGQKNVSRKRARDMHLYRLPWPIEALDELPGETPITINITLSYFIEPAPGEKGWRDKYRYRSHGLDFNIKTPTETDDEFILRLNKAAREDNGDYGGKSVDWAIGEKKGRTHGSIHRDWPENLTAADAKECNIIGIFPRSGWWKERDHLGRGNSQSRYSLIVTLSTPSTDIDLYTPIANLISPEVEV